MEDLVNERDAVCQKLISFNFEPVNAEGWVPTGAKSWYQIRTEIESSDVFVLLLGERYGWIPKEGPQAYLGLSVTHLEYQEARKLDIPILPFLKELSYDAKRNTQDAKKRDKFRAEVGEWAEGQFFGKFRLASDLADRVGRSLVQLLSDDFLTGKIQARTSLADQADQVLRRLDTGLGSPAAAQNVQIPAQLAVAVARREAVLFAGSGISMPAGLPSAAVFSQRLAQALLQKDPDYGVSPVGSAFAAIASDVEAFTSRENLILQVGSVLHPPQGLQPTVAHSKAVTLFDTILTTNWDSLFEAAAAEQKRELPVIASEIIDELLPNRALIKLHGSYSDPSSLLLTETDILRMDQTRPRLWEAVRSVLHARPLVVVGTSLRDPSIVRLFAEAAPQRPGYLVVPRVLAATAARLRAWNLECIAADADSFFSSLAEAVGS